MEDRETYEKRKQNARDFQHPRRARIARLVRTRLASYTHGENVETIIRSCEVTGSSGFRSRRRRRRRTPLATAYETEKKKTINSNTDTRNVFFFLFFSSTVRKTAYTLVTRHCAAARSIGRGGRRGRKTDGDVAPRRTSLRRSRRLFASVVRF